MKKKLNINTILIGFVLVIAIGSYAFMQLTKSEGSFAVVTNVSKDSQETIIFLNDDGEHFIDGILPTTLLVENGTIKFINSQCPDHICEAYGELHESYHVASCLPAGVVVTIETDE